MMISNQPEIGGTCGAIMGIHKRTHYNTVITPDVIAKVEDMRKQRMTYPQIADALGICRKTVMNAASEHNLGERTKVYKAAFCDKWDFSGENVCAKN
jgi:hypothetical protein